jgi:DNA (cytosine-5)-methyltransferase 1
VLSQVTEQGPNTEQLELLPGRTVAEFFAGIGLMRLGLEGDSDNWRVVFSNDIDAKKEQIYSSHFGDAHSTFFQGDIHQLDASKVPSVTLATASFPCTDLSLAGGRHGIHGEQSSAFWGFTRVLREMGSRRPPLVLLENVTGFLTSNKGHDFLAAMQELNGLGYAVDAFILDAVRFVPQSRQRLFIVGVDEGVEHALSSSLPVPLISDVRPKSLAHYIVQHQGEIRWRIRPLPALPHGTSNLTSILEDLPDSHEAWWNAARAEKLLNQMSPRHRTVAEAMTTADEWSYGTVFRRMRKSMDTGASRSMAELRTDGIAGCLRTPKGGSAKQILFKAGFGRYMVRLIQPIEAARLMGAGDYTLPKNSDQALFAFGDAVAVPVVAWVKHNYLNPLMDELLMKSPKALDVEGAA